MTGTRRCQQCGLTQMASEACRRCGSALAEPRLGPRRPVRARTEVHPALGIWLSPRETIRSLVATDPTRGVLSISWLVGTAMFLDGMLPKVEAKLPVGAAILGSVLAGPLLAFFLVFVEALFTAGAGRLLGGRAGLPELRAALAWANAPLLLLFAVSGLRGAGLSGTAAAGLGLALFLWVEVLAVLMVAEVNDFSVLRGLGAIVVAWLLKITVLIGFAVLFTSLAPPESAPDAEAPAAAASGS